MNGMRSCEDDLSRVLTKSRFGLASAAVGREGLVCSSAVAEEEEGGGRGNQNIDFLLMCQFPPRGGRTATCGSNARRTCLEKAFGRLLAL